uniref:Uncharacterized protein n=1 Tax=Salix viminalis TaxID=40686 RepID=A0A6N2N6C6_SALVM
MKPKARCSNILIENRTNHVSSFLEMLRSASVSEDEVSRTSETSHGGWKMKEDHEEFRVMYRPGPEGSPFHSLLVEGYVDATVDACKFRLMRVLGGDTLQEMVRMLVSWHFSSFCDI